MEFPKSIENPQPQETKQGVKKEKPRESSIIKSLLDEVADETILIEKTAQIINDLPEDEKKWMYKKYGLDENITLEQLHSYLDDRMENYKKACQEIAEKRKSILEGILNWLSDNNFSPSQKPEDIPIIVIDPFFNKGLEKKTFHTGDDRFDPQTNAICASTNISPGLLAHEFMHGMAFDKNKRICGFKKVEENDVISGNTWLDEGCAMIGEKNATQDDFRNKEQGGDLYQEGYYWLTNQLVEVIGFSKNDLMKAFLSQGEHRQKLIKSIKDYYHITNDFVLEDLSPLLIGFNNESRQKIRKILNKEPVTLRAVKGSGLDERYIEFQKIFPWIEVNVVTPPSLQK